MGVVWGVGVREWVAWDCVKGQHRLISMQAQTRYNHIPPHLSPSATSFPPSSYTNCCVGDS